jgi:hypothetical protein
MCGRLNDYFGTATIHFPAAGADVLSLRGVKRRSSFILGRTGILPVIRTDRQDAGPTKSLFHQWRLLPPFSIGGSNDSLSPLGLNDYFRAWTGS